MRILVTGGAGFIGSFLVDRLLAGGHAVRVLDNLDPQVHPDGRPPHLAPGVELMVGDVRGGTTCDEALEDVDVVVHAGGAVGVAQSLYRVEHYVDTNVKGMATLLGRLGERRGAIGKLVLLTSMTAYGEGMYRRPSDGRLLRVPVRSEAQIARWGWEPVCPETGERLEPVPTSEGAELQARNIYALTKRYQEELALSFGAVHRIPVVCLRLFNVYGPRQSLSNPYTGVLAIFLSRLLRGAAPVIYEDGGQTRDFVSVHDVVDAVVAGIASSEGDGAVLNIGSGIPRRIRDVARDVARAAGVAIGPTVSGEYRRDDVRHCTADISQARQRLGFAPRVAWEEGLAELAQWARGAKALDPVGEAEQELRSWGLLTAGLTTAGKPTR